ncbi:MAG: hypothetical protein PHQ23_17450 [Candidatus Wallbacteria bacterium]|nr:hypothetical protein [Candidatus Wallbacteria bacterium]
MRGLSLVLVLIISVCIHADFDKAFSLYQEAITQFKERNVDKAVELYGMAIKEDPKILQESDEGLGVHYLRKLEREAPAMEVALAYLDFANIAKAREFLNKVPEDVRLSAAAVYQQAVEKLNMMEKIEQEASQQSGSDYQSEGDSSGSAYSGYQDEENSGGTDSDSNATYIDTNREETQRTEKNDTPREDSQAVKDQKEVVEKAKKDYDNYYTLWATDNEKYESLYLHYKQVYEKEQAKLDKLIKDSE